MGRELKQSTAATVKIGPFVGTTGTVLTALTIAQADVRVSKNGGNMAQKNEGTACVHDELGVYDCVLDATDTGTLGRLRLDIDKSGSAALMDWEIFEVVTANYWDTKYSTDKFDVNVAEITAAIITAGTIASDAIAAAKIATGAITADAFAANAITAGTIADDAIAAAKLATGAISADAFAAAALTAGTFADDAIAAATIATGAFTAAAFAATAISSGVFAANALTAGIFAGSCLALSNFDATYRMYVAEGIPKNQAFDLHVLMVDSDDHRTGITGLSTMTMTRTIGSAGSFSAGSASISEIGNGFYLAELAASDTNGDVITYRFYCTADAADDTFIEVRTSA